MPKSALDRDEAIRLIAEVERALEEGYRPPGAALHGHNLERGALRIVADRRGLPVQTVFGQVGSPTRTGSTFRLFGLKVDWSKYKAKPPAPPLSERNRGHRSKLELEVQTLRKQVEAGIVPADPIEVRKLRDDNSRLRELLKEAERRAAAAEDLRQSVLGLGELTPPPMSFPPRDMRRPALRETIVLFLSDLQWGETVDLAQMDGLNNYNVSIARKRLARWAEIVVELSTKHWSGPSPDRVILILGGDLISGAIHFELAKTDELPPLAAVRDAAEHLRNAILRIKSGIDCPIDIISLAGNHGRTTIKPESKQVAITSFDILVSDFLEMSLKGVADVNFYIPASPDHVFSVYGWRVLATHGDRIGSRGGTGFVGVAATAARGMKRLVQDYSARGIHLDLILMGHFHTPLELEEGFVNGSLPGPTEYSRDFRFRPHPATQLYLTMHPHRRCALRRWIDVGSPEEGSLYEPPPPDRPLRPRFRVKAVTEKVDAQGQDAADRDALSSRATKSKV